MTVAGYVMATFTIPTGGAVVAATSNAGGPTNVTVPAGAYTLVTLCTEFASQLNTSRPITAGTWTVTLSYTGSSPTGRVTIAGSAGTVSITWTSTLLRDILGFDANLSAVTTSTGAGQARGLWLPDVSLVADGDLQQANYESDRRESRTPTGRVFSRNGSTIARHTGLEWSMVARNRIHITHETTGGVANQSYERFHLDAIDGTGHAWFTPGSKLAIMDHRSVVAGSAYGTIAWYGVGIPPLSTLRMSQGRWTGLWRVQWPEIVGELL